MSNLIHRFRARSHPALETVHETAGVDMERSHSSAASTFVPAAARNATRRTGARALPESTVVGLGPRLTLVSGDYPPRASHLTCGLHDVASRG
jgi:hypothetical protein